MVCSSSLTLRLSLSSDALHHEIWWSVGFHSTLVNFVGIRAHTSSENQATERRSPREPSHPCISAIQWHVALTLSPISGMRIASKPDGHLALSPLVILAISAYDKAMDITLTPEMEALIRHYMARRSYPSPESVVMQALVALREVEAMHTPQHPDDLPLAATPSGHASALVQWLQTTAGPDEGLEALHYRLAAISGSMAETVRADRDDRL